jgi:hypothetical protein
VPSTGTPPEHIEDGVEHLAQVYRPRTPAAFGRPDQRRNQRPFGIGQIARVAQSAPIRSGTMLGLPHGAPRVDSDAAHKITTDSSDSTSFRNGSKLDFGRLSRVAEHGGQAFDDGIWSFSDIGPSG